MVYWRPKRSYVWICNFVSYFLIIRISELWNQSPYKFERTPRLQHVCQRPSTFNMDNCDSPIELDEDFLFNESEWIGQSKKYLDFVRWKWQFNFSNTCGMLDSNLSNSLVSLAFFNPLASTTKALAAVILGQNQLIRTFFGRKLSQLWRSGQIGKASAVSRGLAVRW